MKKIFLILIVLLIIIGGLFYLYVTTPVDKNSKEEINITIPIGTGTNGIANILEQNDLIKSSIVFKVYVKLGNITGFQAGEYILKKSMTLREITDILKTGKMGDPNQINITYIEGKGIDDLAELIADKTNNRKQDLYNLLENKEYIDSLIAKYWFLDEEIKNKEIYYPLEGYLFPDTYTFKNKDVKVEEIVEQMLDQMGKVLSEYKDLKNGKRTVHEILTMASIIECESKSVEGRKDVASVFYNRMDKGISLGSDVTTYYAFKIKLWERELTYAEINTNNPYNTRGPNMISKLPVGPIASASKSSIEAALSPNKTDYLFFVADKNGDLYFTKTQGEHDRIIRELKSEDLWYTY